MISWKDLVLGNDYEVPVEGNKLRRYINFDNASSTPAFKKVVADTVDYLGWYSNIHRGEGYKSRLSTCIYENCREEIANFLGLGIEKNTIVFVKNTTEAINKLANYMSFDKQPIVISTIQEHHSNDLPWRKRARVLYGRTKEDGTLDHEHVRSLLEKNKGKVRLLTVTGASNVTGNVNNIYYLAELAHTYGAEIMVDGAQIIPHMRVDMLADDSPQHIDYIAFSGHKTYAPLGIGVLAGKKRVIGKVEPDIVGGGTVALVTHNSILWSPTPAKEEAGTPNIPGAIALSSALNLLDELGMDKVEAAEKALAAYFLHKIEEIPGIRLYGSKDIEKRIGVFAFSLDGISHTMVASILSSKYAIGVRNGLFCAHPYLFLLLNISESETKRYEKSIKIGKPLNMPGLVRVSFGLYNTFEEVDCLINALREITERKEKFTRRKFFFSFCLINALREITERKEKFPTSKFL